MSQEIIYKMDVIPDIDQVIALYIDAGLNRPVDNKKGIEKMYANSNLIITAWDGTLLIGVSRALTDFSHCCYLSDLAVRSSYQGKGVGRELVAITKLESGNESMLLLLSVPSALTYYPTIGLRKAENAFIMDRQE